MPNLSGTSLESYGKAVFEEMNLLCLNPLNQVQLNRLKPSSPYNTGEHLELDYLIPINGSCVIGEITSRSNSGDVTNKYRKFRRHFDFLSSLDLSNPEIWALIGVPSEKLIQFRHIRDLKGIFIVADLQRSDVPIANVANIECFFKAEWELLGNYVSCIGEYTKPLFLSGLLQNNLETRRPIEINADSNRLIRICDRKITSGNIGLSDLFCFEASPYELLPYACVYRHDILPSLDSSVSKSYQRPLIPEKLKGIRENLLNDINFIFPNSILVVLSENCRYQEDTQSLRIPDYYGSISVIDGQHRLFSYANNQIRARMGEEAKIMVTAIQFQTRIQDELQKFSAKAFIEINSTQTPVKSAHIDAIAFPILGEVYPRAIAAQVILITNSRKDKKLYGLFDTNQTSLGKIQTSTVLTALQSITSLSNINNLQNAQRGKRILIKQGYENLFSCCVSDLIDPNILIEKCVVAIERYFNLVSTIFQYDWIKRNITNGSSLEFTKFFSAFIRLFGQFISEGLNWEQVEHELIMIRTNVITLCSKTAYDSILFDPSNIVIPNASPSLANNFRFLNENRNSSTSIQTILPGRNNLDA